MKFLGKLATVGFSLLLVSCPPVPSYHTTTYHRSEQRAFVRELDLCEDRPVMEIEECYAELLERNSISITYEKVKIPTVATPDKSVRVDSPTPELYPSHE